MVVHFKKEGSEQTRNVFMVYLDPRIEVDNCKSAFTVMLHILTIRQIYIPRAETIGHFITIFI